MRMKGLRMAWAVFVLGTALTAAPAGCQSILPSQSKAIRSERQVEELVFENGAARWSKVGNVSVKTEKKP